MTEKLSSLTEKDLYALLGVEPTATTQEIKKAYRKKALSCHPDKNPDNPRAAELFHELSYVLEILIDTSARAAYDKVLNARQQAKERVKEFDAKRKKFKDDLEAREEAYQRSLNVSSYEKNDEHKLQAEIERLSKEGSKQVEEEIALVRKQIYEQLHGSHKSEDGPYRIKIKWKATDDDPNNGGYDHDTLFRILSKYGDIIALVVSSVKKGKALVEFRSKQDAEMAANLEIGFVANPLTLKRLWKDEAEGFHNIFAKMENATSGKKTSSGSTKPASDERGMSDAEFELSVLNNLRRAEERKRNFGRTGGKEDT